MENITKEQVLKSYENGNILYITMQGINEMPLDEFMQKDASDILKLLNRTEEILIMLHEKNPSSLKWVNDFAVAKLIQALKMKLASIESTATVEVENNDDELKNAENKIKELKTKIAEYENQISHFNATVTEYNESIDMIEEDKEKLTAENKNLKIHIDELKQQNETMLKLHDENNALNKTIDALNNDKSRLSEKNNSLLDENNELKNKNSEMMKLIDGYKAQINEMSVQVADMKKRIAHQSEPYTLEVYVDPSDESKCKVSKKCDVKVSESTPQKHATQTQSQPKTPAYNNNLNTQEPLTMFNI